MAISCVVCKKPVTLYKKSPTDSLDEQLAVVFFLKKFLKYPVVPSEDVFKDIEERDGLDLLENLLKFKGNPSDWIHFCSCCLPTVQEAKCLFKILTELEGKISILREKIEKSVVESFQPDQETFERDGKNLFETVRARIYKENMPPTGPPTPQIEQSLSFPNVPESLPISPAYIEINIEDAVKTEEVVEEFQQIEVETGWYETPEAPDNTEGPSLNYGSQDQVESNFSTVDQEDIEMYYSCGPGGSAESEPSAETLSSNSASASGFSGSNPILEITGSEGLRTFGTGSSIVTESSQTSRQTFVTSNAGSRRTTTDTYQNTPQAFLHNYPRKADLALRTCTACHLTFDKPGIMMRHFKSVHKKGSLFRCDACKRGFSRKDSLRRHVLKYCSKMMARSASANSAAERNEMQDHSSNSTDTQPSPATASAGLYQILPIQEGAVKLEIHSSGS